MVQVLWIPENRLADHEDTKQNATKLSDLMIEPPTQLGTQLLFISSSSSLMPYGSKRTKETRRLIGNLICYDGDDDDDDDEHLARLTAAAPGQWI